MSKEILLFSTGCPKCRVLETKLKEKGIQYTLSNNIEEMERYCVSSVPTLIADDKLMKFADAVAYVTKWRYVNNEH